MYQIGYYMNLHVLGSLRRWTTLVTQTLILHSLPYLKAQYLYFPLQQVHYSQLFTIEVSKKSRLQKGYNLFRTLVERPFTELSSCS